MSAFGGTLRHPRLGDEGWAARPLDAIDFEHRPGIPYTGWPFDLQHLDPYYARAQRLCDLGVYPYEPEAWTDVAARRCALPLDGGEVDTTVFQFAQPPFQDALEQFSGSANVQVLLHSRVVGMTTYPNERRVDTVLARRRDGSSFVIRPRIVVLAAGGVENARILLSANGMRGLGNEHDLVGRFFAERLSVHAGHIVTPLPHLIERAAFYDLHHVGRTLIRGALRVTDKIQRHRDLLNCAFFVLPRPEAVTTDAVRSLATLRKAVARKPLLDNSRQHIATVIGGVGDIADLALSRGKGARRRLIIRAQAEQAPNRDSRVTLGSRRDSSGLPVPRITWRMNDSDAASINASLDIVDSALRSSGLGVVQSAMGDEHRRPLMEGNHHHLGTTRMHVDPRNGVVDANCRVHTVANLYVSGSSVFPTYGSSNPTLTIVALAVRLADHLANQFASGADRPGHIRA